MICHSRKDAILALALGLLLAAGGAARAQTAVDVEIALLADTSGSVGASGYTQQRDGYIAAFNNPSVANAIASGALGSIAVNLVDWDSSPTQVTGWFLIDGTDGHTASDYADLIAASWSGSASGGTNLTSAINSVSMAGADAGVDAFSENSFNGRRNVIDISTDGSPNSTSASAAAAAAALAGDVDTINAIAIGSGADTIFLQGQIIGGDGAFLLTPDSFEEFADAILEKLVAEVTGNIGAASTDVMNQVMLGRNQIGRASCRERV